MNRDDKQRPVKHGKQTAILVKLVLVARIIILKTRVFLQESDIVKCQICYHYIFPLYIY